MNVVAHSADGECCHRVVFANRGNVCPEARLNIVGNEFTASFSGEDQVDVVLCVAGQWCLALSCSCVAPYGAHHHTLQLPRPYGRGQPPSRLRRWEQSRAGYSRSVGEWKTSSSVCRTAQRILFAVAVFWSRFWWLAWPFVAGAMCALVGAIALLRRAPLNKNGGK
jgi:hypothetical protein